MKLNVSKQEDGFSIIEVMIVVAIMAIIAAIARPKFGEFKAKARMAEAKTNLSNLYTLQRSYLPNQSYVAISGYGAKLSGAGTSCNNQSAEGLGFDLSPCNTKVPRYRYSVTTTSNTFVAGAVQVRYADRWITLFAINQNKILKVPKIVRTQKT